VTDRNAENEPTNLVLEQLRLMRAENSAQFKQMASQFDEIRADIKALKTAVRGFQHQTIAEIYKANLTVSAFADLDRRVTALEDKFADR
jgi:hypothetical protein